MWLFIFGCVCLRGCADFSLVVSSRGHSSLWCAGFSLQWPLAAVHRLQQLWFLGSRAQTQQLWCTGLGALGHVRSSWTRDQTHVSYIGRPILYHWDSRKAQKLDTSVTRDDFLPWKFQVDTNKLTALNKFFSSSERVMLKIVKISLAPSVNGLNISLCPE